MEAIDVGTPVFDKLPQNQKEGIKTGLYEHQQGVCYICGELLDLAQPLDIDHIQSRDRGGADNLGNWGLTHAHCNQSKGNRDLDLLRHLSRFAKARRTHIAAGQAEDSFTLGVALSMHGGGAERGHDTNRDGHHRQ